MGQTSYSMLDAMNSLSRKLNIAYKLPGVENCEILIGQYINDLCNMLTIINNKRKSENSCFRYGINLEISNKYNFVVYETNGVLKKAIIGLRCSNLRIDEYFIIGQAIPVQIEANGNFIESPKIGSKSFISKVKYSENVIRFIEENNGYSVKISSIPAWAKNIQFEDYKYNGVQYDKQYFRTIQSEFTGFKRALDMSMQII